MKRLSYILWGLETIALTSSMALMITALVCFAAMAALIVYVVFYRKGQRAVVLCPQCQIPMHQTLSSAITPSEARVIHVVPPYQEFICPSCGQRQRRFPN